MKKIIALAVLVACPVAFSADLGAKASYVLGNTKEAAKSGSRLAYNNTKTSATWLSQHPVFAGLAVTALGFALRFIPGSSSSANSNGN